MKIAKRDTFQKRRQRMICLSKSTSETKDMDSIGVYPIEDAGLLDIASSPHKMLFLATVYLRNVKKTVEHGGNEQIALYKLIDTNTAAFVNSVVNPRLSRYEIGYSDSAYLFQLVFDSYEWRTFLYHMIIMEIPGADSLIRIDEENKQVIVEKKAPFRSSLLLNFGYHIACLCYALRMIQKKSVTDLTTVKDGRYDAEIKGSQFVFRVKTSLPATEEDTHALKERYLRSLHAVINYKLTTRSV